ncbi:tripartite tricarboxylate transporter substrate binding protein [Bordetella hinzii]|uniref:tripartite tricarboxylate transporter substrate binding protein n=1 Tax=Bordetella hinzii TaxID=103855 RepID=UPI000459CBAA|nr:tripartite tricarboxylate transporter substrate binding protein [Bordetella hinzii]KCB44740.1 tripartite tricarboxylate transporter family receptor [Bordetella hinzii 4161]KXA73345.1 ABC transporter substrate-binding protein [Bordetella hinzii LMG 13501]QDJ39425.1 tripartite tricarboxylate transporter substrate binding protein [Bordetella hinzii]QDJ57409.1 tripartite tricarboxylate transporter substrate binding protein [Bordetella hinzii]VEH23408.1 putattive exported protein [Bordetella hin
MHSVNRCRAALGALALSLVFGGPAHPAYPARPVQLIIPFSPGDTDQMLRPITEKMGQYLGQPIVMNYKPGAGGGIGAAYTASAAADGYTLVGSSPGALVVVPLANKEIKYTTDSFAPVAAISLGGMMIVAPGKSKYKTLADVVADARARPDGIAYGTSGAMGISHLLGETFASEAQIKLRHIPFQGSTPAVTALLGGHTDIAVTAVGPAQAHIQSGGLRPLAVFSSKRLAAYPDVPTLRELGYDVGSPTLYGLMAPKGTPPQVIDTLYQAARKVVAEQGDEVSKTLGTIGAEVSVLGPREYGAYLQEQRALFSRAIGLIRE